MGDLKDPKKLNEAIRLARMILSGHEKRSVVSLNNFRKIFKEYGFSDDVIAGIDFRIEEAKKFFADRNKQIDILIEKGLKENNTIFCKKCNDLKCKTTISCIDKNKALIGVFCGEKEILVNPYKIDLIKSAQYI